MVAKTNYNGDNCDLEVGANKYLMKAEVGIKYIYCI